MCSRRAQDALFENNALIFIYCVLDEDLYVKMSNFPMLSLHVRAVHFSLIGNLTEKRLAFVAFHSDEWMKNPAVPLQLPKLMEVKNSCEFTVSFYTCPC